MPIQPYSMIKIESSDDKVFESESASQLYDGEN
jgi:hypothetical protein